MNADLAPAPVREVRRLVVFPLLPGGHTRVLQDDGSLRLLLELLAYVLGPLLRHLGA